MLLAYLTGGRPMKRLERGSRFTDVVNGQPVFLYEDAFGRRWLAHHSWACFRVAPSFPEVDAHEVRP